jgi:predicted nuclease of predicted toxin-antitoxin system
MPTCRGRLSTCLLPFGHEAQFARDVGLADAPDAVIAARAQASAAAIVTRDLDFGDIRRYPPADYAGIVVLRLPDDSIASEIVDVLRGFLAESALLAALAGRLAIVESGRVRFRPPLDR